MGDPLRNGNRTPASYRNVRSRQARAENGAHGLLPSPRGLHRRRHLPGVRHLDFSRSWRPLGAVPARGAGDAGGLRGPPRRGLALVPVALREGPRGGAQSGSPGDRELAGAHSVPSRRDPERRSAPPARRQPRRPRAARRPLDGALRALRKGDGDGARDRRGRGSRRAAAAAVRSARTWSGSARGCRRRLSNARGRSGGCAATSSWSSEPRRGSTRRRV